MKKTGLIVLLLIALAGGVMHSAAQDTDDPDEFIGVLDVESGFTRELPTRDSDSLSSIFEDDKLEAVGRNIDGTWFEVRRPGRMTTIGWIRSDLLRFEFDPAQLPMTDWETGLEGPTPLTGDPGFAVFMNYGAVLRMGPSRFSTGNMAVPLNTTVPILARNQDGSWLYVNYIGYTGWIVAFVGREVANVMDIPEAPNLPPLESGPVVIIPPEVQLQHIQHIRGFTEPLRDLSQSLEWFWAAVNKGDTMPCNPPPEVVEYQYSPADVRELPELDRYAPQLNQAVSYLNQSIAPLENCGVVSIDEVRHAQADAVNARVLFDSTLINLDNLEATIR